MWEKVFRNQIKTISKGWSVQNARKKVWLRVRKNGLETQSVLLPFTWQENNVGDVLIRVRNIYNLTLDGNDLKTAAFLAENKNNKLLNNLDWDDAADKFKKSLTNVAAITWKNKYEPAIKVALHYLTKTRKINNAADLTDVVLEKWIGKTEQHAISRRALWKFLKYCVNRLNYANVWLPPTEIPSAGKRKPRKVGYPISDSQFINLIDSLNDPRWIFAIQLCCVYGLRPEELRYLHTRNEGTELWTNYTKSKGGIKGDTTQPRLLLPVLVKDENNKPIDWNLLQRIQINEEVPSIGKNGQAGQSIRRYLRNKPMWLTIKKQAELEGQNLIPYSFRHRYSKQLHKTHLRPKQIAECMGHDLKTHLLHYARFISDDMSKEFDLINA
jgi:hypothetical protein